MALGNRAFGPAGSHLKQDAIVESGGRFGAPGDPFTATAAVATDGSNKTLVTVTVKDANGTAVAIPVCMDIWLSDATSGFGLTTTTASGAVAGKTDGTTGVDLATLVSKKALRVQTTAAGSYQLSITDTAKTAFKVCVAIAGRAVVVATLATASYA